MKRIKDLKTDSLKSITIISAFFTCVLLGINYIFGENIEPHWLLPFFCQVLMCVTMVFYVFYLVKLKQYGKPLLWSSGVIAAAGVAVHFWAFWEGVNNFIPVALKSAMSSIKLFLFDPQFVEIYAEHGKHFFTEHSGTYLCLYIFISMMAVITSAVFVIKTVASFVLSRKYLKNNHQLFAADNVYVFLGISDITMNVAKSLIEGNADNEDKVNASDIIFIHEPTHEKEPEKLSIKTLLLNASRRYYKFSNLFGTKYQDYTILSSSQRIRDVSLGFSHTQNDDARKKASQLLADELNLQGFDMLLNNENASIFLISEDEQSNLDALKMLLACKTECRIYCNARSDNAVSFYEKGLRSQNVIFIDSARLSINSLKKDHFEYHPVNFVKVEEIDGRKTGCVVSDFNSLILGFGETGQEALAFLYEYGAFVGCEGVRSGFHALAYDSNMSEIENTYKLAKPGLEEGLVTFRSAKVGTNEFWNELRNMVLTDKKDEFLHTVNYAVVALGNDQRNLAVGLELLDLISTIRDGEMKNLIVLIHLVHPSTADVAAIEYYQRKHGKCVDYFGSGDDIWKYDVITNSDIIPLADEFCASYNVCSGWGAEDMHPVTTRMRQLDDKKKLLRKLSGDKFTEKLHEVLKEERTIYEDITNSIHKRTKLALCDNDPKLVKEALNHIPGEYSEKLVSSKEEEMPHYMGKDEFYQKVLTNLAIGEHIRWVASHEMLGFRYRENMGFGDTSDIKRLHRCMIPYDQLTPALDKEKYEYQYTQWKEGKIKKEPKYTPGQILHYDWVVVKTTLTLMK